MAVYSKRLNKWFKSDQTRKKAHIAVANYNRSNMSSSSRISRSSYAKKTSPSPRKIYTKHGTYKSEKDFQKGKQSYSRKVQRNEEMHDIITAYANNGASPYDTKVRLQNEGYSEKEISSTGLNKYI